MRSIKKLYLLFILVFLTGCQEKAYTITFDTAGGTVMENITINEGNHIENITPPSKDGYLFVNWLKDGIEYNIDSPVTEDIKLTASWIETPEIYKYYKVTYITSNKEENITVKEGEKASKINAPIIEKYKFIGWYLEDKIFDFETPITKDITLIAKYELDKVTITYDLDGGIGLEEETIKKNTTISIPEAPTKEGYKFLKWTLNDEEFSFDTKITKDITLKANWIKIEYVNVSFDTDGANIIEPIKIEKYSKLKELPIPEKEGYKFLYWSLDNERFIENTKIERDITLKAIYKEENYGS